MNLIKLSRTQAIDWDSVYAITVAKCHQDSHYPTELWIFCDDLDMKAGEPSVIVSEPGPVSSVKDRVTEDARFKQAERLFYDKSKLSSVVLSNDQKSASVGFRFAPDRAVRFPIRPDDAAAILSEI